MDSQQNEYEKSDEEYEKDIKTKILGASLKFVHDLGWSKQAISAGAESIGYPGVIHGLFPNGGVALVQYFYTKCNHELNEILQKKVLADVQNDVQDDSFMSRKAQHVRDAVETRVRMMIPYKKTWPQAIAIMALPQNVTAALANLLILVDDICYHLGDRSVDIKWYGRRMILASIYKSTELYVLQDASDDHKATWLFLDRRIKEALEVNSIFANSGFMSDETLNLAAETASSAFITARNLLGINWNKY